MFVAELTSFLACTSACLAAFLSNPIDTNVAMASSDGSTLDAIGAGWDLCKWRSVLDNINTLARQNGYWENKRMRLASARRPVLGNIVPTMVLLGAGGGELPKEGRESREKNEATNSGNCDVFRHKFNVTQVTLESKKTKIWQRAK